MTEPNYEYATNAAYAELLHYNGHFPQIDIFELIHESGNIKLKTYSQAAYYYNCSHNEFTYNIAQSEFGFTILDLKNNRHIIYYNDYKDSKTIRFTLAHELGHIKLGHDEDNKRTNREANCFARNILCPVQLIDGFNLSTADDYVECFDISRPMAEVSLAHFKSDSHYISRRNYEVINDKIYCYMTGYTLRELYNYY
jgi:Zn-dependent peptidase ImmA (M78 family)